MKDDGFIKCYNPLKNEILHLPSALPVKWVFGTDDDSKGKISLNLKDVPRVGLFIYGGEVYQKV